MAPYSVFTFPFRYEVYLTDRLTYSFPNRPSGWFHAVLNFMGTTTSIYQDGVKRIESEAVFHNFTQGDGRIAVSQQYSELDWWDAYSSVQVDKLLFFNQTLTDVDIIMLSKATTT